MVPVIRFGKARRAVKVLQATTQRIIAERRARRANMTISLDMLLRTHDEDGSRLTDAQVCGQVLRAALRRSRDNGERAGLGALPAGKASARLGAAARRS